MQETRITTREVSKHFGVRIFIFMEPLTSGAI